MYKLPNGQMNLVKLQEEVLLKWKSENSFKESIKNREGESEFVFYDGPPFANGLPHYGHLLTSYVKDSVARFQTMIGNKTERRFGWDCHGLPAEMETEKELQVSGRTQIMEYGIDKFNQACRASVMKYSGNWQEYIEKAGRWVDFTEDYKTMDVSYMESVLWGFKELYKKGLLYEDFRVMPYSWKCETPLSNFETKLDNSYRSYTSKTATVKFKLITKPENLEKYTVFALIWTTTGWTLPSNLAIAVNPKLKYVAIKTGEAEVVLISKKLASKYEKEIGKEVIAEFEGFELLGLKYQPLFKFFENTPNAFKIIAGNFVEETDGTGMVHIAPGFGEDDNIAAKEAGIKTLCPVDDGGKFTSELFPYMDFKTARLSLRSITEDDDDTISEILKHHPEMDFVKDYKFFTEHNVQYGTAPMAVVLNGEMIGIAGILAHNPEKLLVQGNVEILFFLKSAFQKKGYGLELGKFFAKLAFTRFGVSEIMAVVSGENPASVKTLEAIGFKEVDEIFDPRSLKNIRKFVLSSNPHHLKTQNLEFKIEGELPSNMHYKASENTYFIYHKHKLIGGAELTEGNLDYGFLPETEEELIMEALAEIIERFGFGEIQTKHLASGILKSLGFFEQKETKVVKRNSEVLHLAGRQVLETSEDIITFLKQSGSLVKQEQYIHNYPHCWRTDTPLIYKAVSSWYVEVTKIKDRMVELNKEINWIPNHIKEGQFGKWLENARDWSITRNRFWGTPVPVWKVVHKETGEEIPAQIISNCDLKSALNVIAFNQGIDNRNAVKKNQFDNIKIKFQDGTESFFLTVNEAITNISIFPSQIGDISYKRNYVFGSISELNEFFGSDVKDLHRPFIDDLILEDPYNSNYEIKRVTDVLDCWFESGSMPFASIHYPFEKKEWFEKNNPADFIVEYVAQTRGWFYTLMVLGTAIFDKAPFKTCLCHGVILDENGQKLSKRLKNYPDPLEVFETYGSDAMRFFLLSSNVVSGGDLNVSRDGAEIRDVVRLVIKPIWNAYTFFAMYANADKIKAKFSFKSEDVMDKYIFSKLSFFANDSKLAFENYDFPAACKKVEEFIDVLNNWYIRRSKERFWKEEKDADKTSAYNTLYTVLTEFAKIISPILPFTAESLFENLA